MAERWPGGVGFRQVSDGLRRGTSRDPKRPGTWRGLGLNDVALLSAWVTSVGGDLHGLYTDVPLGLVPDVDPAEWDGRHQRIVNEKHPLRVDAVAFIGGRWLVIEVKPDAGYVALGQVLTYVYWARASVDLLADSAPMVVTDQVQEVVRPVYQVHRVLVAEVGCVLSGSS